MMAEAVCPICDGTGWKVVERAGLSGATRCECAAVERAQSLRDGSGIPPNYQRASLDTFQIPQDNPIARAGLAKVFMEVKAFVREFPLGEKPGLLLVGETGTGKTHLAVSALKALIEKGHEGLFFDYQSLLEKIRAGWNRDAGTSDREAYASALEAEVLMIDDLGAHRSAEWIEDTVTAIVTHRYNNKLPLIATTNLDVDESPQVAYTSAGGVAVHKKSLAEVIGARSRSRLFEMCRVVRMPQVEDYRVKRGR